MSDKEKQNVDDKATETTKVKLVRNNIFEIFI